MRSLASLEGYLLIDHRNNEGVPDEVVVAQGLPVGSGQGVYEAACYTCSHCETQVVKNTERTRPRGYCKKCNHIICDACDTQYHASGHQCIPFKAFCEEVRNAAERGHLDPIGAAQVYFHQRLTLGA